MAATKTSPKFSIVLPTFNAEEYLEQTLENIFAQGYPDLEFIVIDGGSTDRTLDILRRHESRIAYVESGPDRGQSHAINKGFARATGDLHYWANADDLLEPGALQHVADLMAGLVGPQWVVGGAKLIDSAGRSMGQRVPDRVDDTTFLLWCLKWIPTQSVFWNREMWHTAGPFDEHLHYVMDLGLWQRMHRAAPAIVTDRILGWYRLHATSKSLTSVEKSRAERKRHLARLIAADMLAAQAEGEAHVVALAETYAHLLDELSDQAALVERMRGNRLMGPMMKVYGRFVNWVPELKV